MRLYFMRHAEALDGIDDAARPLSARGGRQAKELGRFLKDAGVRLEAAYSSPLVRARETAEAVLKLCGAVSAEGLQLTDALLIEASRRDFEAWLRCLPDREHVLVVGHAPTLADRVRVLLGISNPESFRLPKAGVACVETDDRRAGTLRFFITPKALGL
jgi:phosphohistidine phosphatase